MNYEQIENYIAERLPAAEKAAFEQAMAQDPALAKAVELYRQVEAQMQAAARAQAGAPALRQQLQALNQQYFGPTAPSTDKMAPVVPIQRRRWPLVLVGSAAVLLAFVLLRPLFSTPVADTDSLYAQYAQYSMSTVADRGDGAANQRSEAIELFNGKQYARALTLFDGLGATDSSDVALAQAACYTVTGDSAKAMDKLRAVTARWPPTAAMHTQAIWYKALLLLKYKDVEGCRQALLTIPANSDFGDQAAALLKALQ